MWRELLVHFKHLIKTNKMAIDHYARRFQRANYRRCAIPKTVKIMLFLKPADAAARTSSPFCRLLTTCLFSSFKTTFLSFDCKNSYPRLIAPSTLFCLTYLLILYVTPNWRWLTVNRPIKMPRPPADEVKNCDSQKTGFRAGDFFLSSPPPPPRFVTRPRPICARVQDGAGELREAG